MADQIVGQADYYTNLCLAWVDRQINLPGWGGLSAANAFTVYGGSAARTTNPQVGDIVLYGSNGRSGRGHAGIYAGNGDVLSVLSDGKTHLTDLLTLSGYEGNTQPIYVSSASLGSAVATAGQNAVSTALAAVGKSPTDQPTTGDVTTTVGAGTTTGGNQTSIPIVTGIGNITSPFGSGPFAGTPGTPSGADAAGNCQYPTIPFSMNPADWVDGKGSANPGPYLAYYWCVITYDLQRGLWLLAGLVIVIIGIWLYSQDKDAPGRDQIETIEQVPGKVAGTAAKAAEIGAAA